jgi:peptide/nickel transport system permease protein
MNSMPMTDPDPAPAVSIRETANEPLARRQSRVWLSLRHNPAFWLGGAEIAVLVFIAVLAPVLSPHDPNVGDLQAGLSLQGDPLGPGGAYLLGTDRLGRDYLSRLLFGTRTSLIVGIGANALATLLGVFVGATAAYVGDRSFRLRIGSRRTFTLPMPIESLLMRATDVMLSFPTLLLAIALVAVLGSSLLLVTVVIAGVMWTGVARIVYGRVMIVKQRDFVEAARALGASGVWLFFRHILPHVLSLIIVYATLGIAGTVLFEATLSYLGVGVPPPSPSWGSMIADGVGYYASDPRLVLLPGLAIMITVLGFSLFGDALRDAMDPATSR